MNSGNGTGEKEPGRDDRKTTYIVYCGFRAITEFRSYNSPELEPDQLNHTAAKAADTLGESCHEKMVDTGHVCAKMVVIRKVDSEKYELAQRQAHAYSMAFGVSRVPRKEFVLRAKQCAYCGRKDIEEVHVVARSKSDALGSVAKGTHGLCDSCHEKMMKYMQFMDIEQDRDDHSN